jgi:hypothetical protein
MNILINSVTHPLIIPVEQDGVEVMFLTHIREVPFWNFGWIIGYPDSNFSIGFLCLPR